jgi:hypothetical protein
MHHVMLVILLVSLLRCCNTSASLPSGHLLVKLLDNSVITCVMIDTPHTQLLVLQALSAQQKSACDF